MCHVHFLMRDANGADPNSLQRLKASRMLYVISVNLLSGIEPTCPLSHPSFHLPHPRRQLNAIPLHSRHLAGMEIRCKSGPTFLACKHLSELRALVTVRRSVWGTLDHCQFGSTVRWRLLLLGKHGRILYEQWNSIVMCLKIIIMLLSLNVNSHQWMTLILHDRWVWSTNIILLTLWDCHCSRITDYLWFAFAFTSSFVRTFSLCVLYILLL